MAIKHEIVFGVDNFGKQKELSEAETIAQMLLNLFLMRPGQLPSLPHIGMDIRKFLYKFEEDINTDQIRDEIVSQCSALLPYISVQQIQVLLVPFNNETILYILIPLTILVDNGGTLIYGFKKSNTSSAVSFNYKIADEQII